MMTSAEAESQYLESHHDQKPQVKTIRDFAFEDFREHPLAGTAGTSVSKANLPHVLELAGFLEGNRNTVVMAYWRLVRVRCADPWQSAARFHSCQATRHSTFWRTGKCVGEAATIKTPETFIMATNFSRISLWNDSSINVAGIGSLPSLNFRLQI